MNLLEEKEYYIAYFDILGYKDFFAHASKKQMQDIVSMIYDGISGIKNYLNRFRNFSFMSILENIEVKFIGFSDNFTFAMQVGEGRHEIYRLLAFLSIIADIQRNFILNYGVLVRGGIVKSTAYINENTIQGKGIIEAVSLEYEAIYPQINISTLIYSDIHQLHFLTYEELEYGGLLQKKINEGLELTLDEQKFMVDARDRYMEELLALTWKDNILMRSKDERPCLNYMYNLDVISYCLNQSIPFNEILNLLQKFMPNISFQILENGYIESLIQVHKSVLINKIKRYGSYADVNINNASDLCEREKIIKKYIWLWAYHNKVCELYGLPKYQVQIILGIDLRVMKSTISFNDSEG